MARRLIIGFGVAVALLIAGIILIATAPAEADHNQYLPYVPNTPLMQNVITTQDYNFCMDNRALTYPNFASQLRDVNARYAERTGIIAREVAFSDPACEVRHTMPSGLSCDGWAAHIFYANRIVDIEYCYQKGYTDWRSAQGHELGHGLLGLHEQYRDSGGSIGCTGRQDTVMDCGSGVRYPTINRDVPLGCAIIPTGWCGSPPAPPPVCQSLGWDPCGQVWRFADGWAYRPSDQNWINPDGWPEWQPCNIFGERLNYHLSAVSGENVVLLPGSAFYSRHFWSSAGAC